MSLIKPQHFSSCVNKMRSFFLKRNFIEVHTQSALSILAACEDPTTISSYNYAGKVWPLPQTGQMWLEDVLLNNPHIEGAFCVSTSYRDEPNPISGRHETIFPMFEFESKGNMADLQKMEEDLLKHLGFADVDGAFPEGDYNQVADQFSTDEIEHEHEMKLRDMHGPVFFLKNFPLRTSPFWNMKFDRETNVAKKIDVILEGMETIGSAERSTDKDEMRALFHTINGGQYRDRLYSLYTKKRVDYELDRFLDRDFFERYGGGIGVTRMINAMDKNNLL